MVLGIPLTRIIKRIRSFRQERYKMFQGYFKGASDVDDDFSSNLQLELHSIEVHENSPLIGRKINSLPIRQYELDIQYLRRPNMLENIDYRPDIILDKGDIIVVLGLPDAIKKFQNKITLSK